MNSTSIIAALAMIFTISSCSKPNRDPVGLGWLATGSNGKSLLIIPTVHLVDGNSVTLPNHLARAITKSEIVYLEIDITSSALAEDVFSCQKSAGIYSKSDAISKTHMGMLREIERKANFPEHPVATYADLALRLSVLQAALSKLGDANHGLDWAAARLAETNKIEVRGLEHICDQIESLTKSLNVWNADNIHERFDQIQDNPMTTMKHHIKKAWSTGNFDEINIHLGDYFNHYPTEFNAHKILCAQRNIKIASSINNIIATKKKRSVALIGYAHFAIGCNIDIDLLRLGTSIRQLTGDELLESHRKLE